MKNFFKVTIVIVVSMFVFFGVFALQGKMNKNEPNHSTESMTEYSKYPKTLTSHNLEEIGDFVVVNNKSLYDYIDFKGYDYIFCRIGSVWGTADSIDDVEIYSFSNGNLLYKKRDLGVFATSPFLSISDSVFKVMAVEQYDDDIVGTIKDYDNETGIFHLITDGTEVLCVPYDSIDWNKCCVYTYERGNYSWNKHKDEIAVAILKQ